MAYMVLMVCMYIGDGVGDMIGTGRVSDTDGMNDSIGIMCSVLLCVMCYVVCVMSYALCIMCYGLCIL